MFGNKIWRNAEKSNFLLTNGTEIEYNYLQENQIPYQEWRRERPDEATATCKLQGAKSGGQRKMRKLCILFRRDTADFLFLLNK